MAAVDAGLTRTRPRASGRRSKALKGGMGRIETKDRVYGELSRDLLRSRGFAGQMATPASTGRPGLPGARLCRSRHRGVDDGVVMGGVVRAVRVRHTMSTGWRKDGQSSDSPFDSPTQKVDHSCSGADDRPSPQIVHTLVAATALHNHLSKIFSRILKKGEA
jgi:hypothetical protein